MEKYKNDLNIDTDSIGELLLLKRVKMMLLILFGESFYFTVSSNTVRLTMSDKNLLLPSNSQKFDIQMNIHYFIIYHTALIPQNAEFEFCYCFNYSLWPVPS